MASHRAMTGCGSADRSAERRVANLSFEDRIKEMEIMKNAGNQYFEEGQYARAVQKYKRVLIFYEYAFPDTKCEEKIIDNLRLVALMNSAACNLKIGDLDEAMENCKQGEFCREICQATHFFHFFPDLPSQPNPIAINYSPRHVSLECQVPLSPICDLSPT